MSDPAESYSWALSVRQGSWARVQQIPAELVTDPLVISYIAERMDVHLFLERGELSPDRRWSIHRSLLTGPEWLAAWRHEQEELGR